MEPLVAAPYGQACLGCVRAKCKCFFQQGTKVCERCHRLKKSCEPSVAVRKRRVRKENHHQEQAQAPSANRLEQKLDEVVSILRSQNLEKSDPLTTRTTSYTPSTSTESYNHPRSPTRPPDVNLDTEHSHVHLTRAENASPGVEPIYGDVLRHHIPEDVAEERLLLFRTAFLSMLPFVHIPQGLRSLELRQQKPFLWLVMMSLTALSADEQFQLEAMIWEIISRRVVTEHRASIDLLLGMIAFSSWSHYFKNNIPFMTTVTSLCVAMALELNLNKPTLGRRAVLSPTSNDQTRSLEERRAFVALFHLSASTWHSYRKIEPLRSSKYLQECLCVLAAGHENPDDALLAAQVRCQFIINQLTSGEDLETPPAVVLEAMLDTLEGIRQSLPADIERRAVLQLYLKGAELLVRDIKLRGDHRQERYGQFQRMQDLHATLDLTEQWLGIWLGIPVPTMMGTTVDIFTHFLHSIVVLFKLTTLDEPGWDVEQVKRRADVFKIMDRASDVIQEMVDHLGMTDAIGTRHGLYFKTTHLFQAIKALFLCEMAPEQRPDPEDFIMDGTVFPDVEAMFDDPDWVPNDLVMEVSTEMWLSDISMNMWNPDFMNQLESSGQLP